MIVYVNDIHLHNVVRFCLFQISPFLFYFLIESIWEINLLEDEFEFLLDSGRIFVVNTPQKINVKNVDIKLNVTLTTFNAFDLQQANDQSGVI